MKACRLWLLVCFPFSKYLGAGQKARMAEFRARSTAKDSSYRVEFPMPNE